MVGIKKPTVKPDCHPIGFKTVRNVCPKHLALVLTGLLCDVSEGNISQEE